MSTTRTAPRLSRPRGTINSDKGNYLSPVPIAEFTITAAGDIYTPVDCLSLPRPVMPAAPAQPQTSLAAASDPYAPATLSRGSRATPIWHRSLAAASRAAGKKPPAKRPRASVKNNKSSFVSRGLVFDQFSRRFTEDNLSECLLLVSYERSLVLLDYDSALTPAQKVEPLAKLFLAKAWPLCHALNTHTAGAQQLDVIVGTSSGDLLWLELASQRYERVNKSGNLTRAPVTAVAWLPNSDSLVVAAHADGFVVVYDVHAEDSTGLALSPSQANLTGSLDYKTVVSLGKSDAADMRQTVKGAYRITAPGKTITTIKFVSPSRMIVASEADYFKLFDLGTETVVDIVPSLFGGVGAVALSGDGRLLAVGGQDDMISVYDMNSKFALCARLLGHAAWVRSVAFDPSSADGYYKLASVGEDRQLCVWDLSPDLLNLPKWYPTVPISPEQIYGTEPHQWSNTPTVVHARVPQYRAPSLFDSGKVSPLLPEFGEADLSDVQFSPKGLIVASGDGRLWTWRRNRR